MMLGDSLKRFLALYSFDPGAVSFALEEMASQILGVGESGAYLSREERAKALKEALAEGVRILRNKTLIDSLADNRGIDDLVEDLGEQGFDDNAWTKQSNISRNIIYNALNKAHKTLSFDEECALQKRLEMLDERCRTSQLAELRKVEISVVMAGWFASHLDTAACAVEQLDRTEFDQLIPVSLARPFKELHVNAVMGNFGTAIILCGALLERALQDLLPSDRGGLGTLIEEGKKSGLLRDHYIRQAYSIAERRNELVHNKGELDFDTIPPDTMWSLIDSTRSLIRDLYGSRLDQEQL